jgi:hypothetical protein
MPESAKLGSREKWRCNSPSTARDRSEIQRHVTPSGTLALDRAAVAGVSASNPFPPLPAEFRGNLIRLQLVFSYNVPAN